MSEISKEPRKRSALGPYYAPEELVQKAVSIPEIAQSITGTDKVAAIIRSFDFFHEWKDKVDKLEPCPSDFKDAFEECSMRVTELETAITEKQQELDAANRKADEQEELLTSKGEEIMLLTAENERLKADAEQNESEKVNSLNSRIAELESQLETLQKRTPDWADMAATIDPVFAEMAEREAQLLSTESDQVSPIRVIMDIFAKYHIYRYTEMPFQRFLPERELEEIINKHYPEMGGLRGLRKKLG